MLKITSCIHAATIVSNLDRAIAFYSGVLGLQRVDRNLNYPGAWFQIGDFQIHLIENADRADAKIDLNVSTRNPHIAFAVGDLDAAKQQLLAANCVVKMSNSGRAALFTQDPDGNAIELTWLGT
ncbi:VOC family protein [Chamaesiphon polymorphus]|uniref:Glyoxalase n=1 Tax=Chamaesiphon polymorphus CCALA 037 TaxID=2107692 RepID=A0A2T1FA01_9CYAN|nr:VOC family protein [Chamaesiphon polymorphus]PSB41766.1 glyoxalase [Chamaesiphon polymorphus CCALA 037]